MKKYLVIITSSNEFDCNTEEPIVCNTFDEAKDTLKREFDKAVSVFEDEFDDDDVEGLFIEESDEFVVYETESSFKHCNGKIWEITV